MLMYDEFNKFLEYLEPKVTALGSVRLSAAIGEFWNIFLLPIGTQSLEGLMTLQNLRQRSVPET